MIHQSHTPFMHKKGARGCTPQSCSFRDHYAQFRELGVECFGLSTQTTAYQDEARQRLHLPFHLLSDSELAFATALRLPTFTVESEEVKEPLIKRLTMVINEEGVVEKVFYPVFPPDKDAETVLAWLKSNAWAEHLLMPTTSWLIYTAPLWFWYLKNNTNNKQRFFFFVHPTMVMAMSGWRHHCDQIGTSFRSIPSIS